MQYKVHLGLNDIANRTDTGRHAVVAVIHVHITGWSAVYSKNRINSSTETSQMLQTRSTQANETDSQQTDWDQSVRYEQNHWKAVAEIQNDDKTSTEGDNAVFSDQHCRRLPIDAAEQGRRYRQGQPLQKGHRWRETQPSQQNDTGQMQADTVAANSDEPGSGPTAWHDASYLPICLINIFYSFLNHIF